MFARASLSPMMSLRTAAALALAASFALGGCAAVELGDLPVAMFAAPKIGKAPPRTIVKKKKKTKKRRIRRGRSPKKPSNPPPEAPPPETPPLEPPPTRVITESESQQILAAHNSARAAVGVAPLQTSAGVSRYAQSWATHLAARGCLVEHRENRPYGENIYWRSNTGTPASAVAAWTAESANYNHADNSCNGQCGHYTQVVWAATTELGCGVSTCNSDGPGGRSGEIWVCNYNPHGNYAGQSPY